MTTTFPIQVHKRRDIKLQCEVDRELAARVDRVAKDHGCPRAVVIRACLEHALRAD